MRSITTTSITTTTTLKRAHISPSPRGRHAPVAVCNTPRAWFSLPHPRHRVDVSGDLTTAVSSPQPAALQWRGPRCCGCGGGGGSGGWVLKSAPPPLAALSPSHAKSADTLMRRITLPHAPPTAPRIHSGCGRGPASVSLAGLTHPYLWGADSCWCFVNLLLEARRWRRRPHPLPLLFTCLALGWRPIALHPFEGRCRARRTHRTAQRRSHGHRRGRCDTPYRYT